MRGREALRRFRAPEEAGAEDRAWQVIRGAYHERTPVARRRFRPRRVGALAAGAVLVGGLVLSPAGASVRRLISHVLGVQHAAPAIFSLPAPGRLLVSGAGGTWTVDGDGSTRRVGAWPEASFSPHGLYLTVVGADELAAVTPRGTPRWVLARRQVADPRWFPPTGYRVAYLSGTDLRVVAGDGTRDHLLSRAVAPIAPAWRPGYPYQLAYLSAAGALVVRDDQSGRKIWSASPRVSVTGLDWSADGQRLLVLSRREVLLYDPGGRVVWTRRAPQGGPIVDGALSPNGGKLALVSGGPGGQAVIVDLHAGHAAARRILAGSGLSRLDWSPNGRWLVISWPAADQWVFVRVAGRPRIYAVSRISEHFSTGVSTAFPRLEGWCCSTPGAAG